MAQKVSKDSVIYNFLQTCPLLFLFDCSFHLLSLEAFLTAFHRNNLYLDKVTLILMMNSGKDAAAFLLK